MSKLEILQKFSNAISLLFVNDDPVCTRHFVNILENFFPNVTIAKNGEEAYLLYTKKHFDIIITDITMPIMDGIDLCKKIRETNSDQVIIISSAHDDNKALLELINLEIDAFIIKPVQLQSLIALLGKFSKRIHDSKELAKFYRLQQEKSEEKDHLLAHQNRLASMGEMLSNIAHQWRQPLNVLAILTQKVELFYEEGILDSTTLQALHKKQMLQIEKMSTTIDDFRNFFKPNKHKECFLLQERIAQLVQLVETSLQKDQIEFECNVTTDIKLIGYPNEFIQVLINIISNAQDAFREYKCIDPKITLNFEKKEHSVLLKIVNNGPIIHKDAITQIFDPYFTTKGDKNGTGIGLYMSKMIIEDNMKGKLEVTNGDIRGVCFTITLNELC
jgi:two-component system, NtrC family, sensor kinase